MIVVTIAVIIMVMVMVMIIRLNTFIVGSAGEISRVSRYLHAIGYCGSARKARLLRIWAEQAGTRRRRVDEPARDVVTNQLVGCGIEVYPGCRNAGRRGAIFDPVGDRCQHIELIGRRSASAVVHIRHGVEPRKVLRLGDAAVLSGHLLIIPNGAEDGRARIASTVVPDDLMPVIDEM